MTRLAMILALALCMPWPASAARLGKLAVLSGVGQPLSAEIEVLVTKEEESSLSANIMLIDGIGDDASVSALRSAGPKVSVEKHGAAVFLKLVTEKPLSRPSTTVFMELRWASGRRMHEYVITLPETVRPPSSQPAPATPLPAMPPAEAPSPPALSPAATPLSASPSTASPPAATQSVATPSTVTPPVSGRTRLVEKGETLSKIVRETRYDGVSAMQMLSAYLQANPDAFVEANMNRLIAGKMLSVPERDAVIAIDNREATALFIAQVTQFDEYRATLTARVADAPAKPERAPSQTATGAIKPPEVTRPTPSATDVLRVSPSVAKSEPSSPSKAPSTEEDKIVNEKTIVDSAERIKVLEKNIEDLRILASITAKNTPPPPATTSILAQSNWVIGAVIASVVLLIAGFLVYRTRKAEKPVVEPRIRRRSAERDSSTVDQPTTDNFAVDDLSLGIKVP